MNIEDPPKNAHLWTWKQQKNVDKSVSFARKKIVYELVHDHINSFSHQPSQTSSDRSSAKACRNSAWKATRMDAPERGLSPKTGGNERIQDRMVKEC